MTPTFAALREACRAAPPRYAVVLGSGLGPVASALRPLAAVPFGDIPGLPAASVQGHKGLLTLGDWAGQRVLLFEGRIHFYEGHPWDVVVRPVQTAAELGAKVLLLTNAAGGIADALGPGSLMTLRDHFEWIGPTPWRRPERPPYSERLRTVLGRAASEAGVELHEGVYAQLTGPCYETPAEIRALRSWGADAVGMSTGREALAAAAAGLEVAAVSCVANKAAGLSDTALSHEEVLAVIRANADRLVGVAERFLALESE
jgi:purine-nucleoside phosphorylase